MIKLKIIEKGINKAGTVFAVAVSTNKITKETGTGVWTIKENYSGGKMRKTWACVKNHMRACDAQDLFVKKLAGGQR